MPYEGLWYLLALSIFVEAVTEAVKGFFPATKTASARVISLAVALVVCVAAKVGLMGLLGVPIRYAVIDYVLTGIIISRGSNVTHDVVKKLRPGPGDQPQTPA